MNLARVNQREMMEVLINLPSSWSDPVFNLKAYSLLGGFLRFDWLWQPEKFNYGLVALLLWDSKPPSCLWYRKQMPRKEGEDHSWIFLTHLFSGSGFAIVQTSFLELGPNAGFPHGTTSKIKGDGWFNTHTHTHTTYTPLLLQELVHIKPTSLHDKVSSSNHRKLWYLGAEDKSA